jgi:thymidylate kinase
MFIILEGADGTGKSTFASLLRERLGQDTVMLHKGPIQKDPIDEYTVDIQWYRPCRQIDVIADRWHWGEEVYGPKYRDGSEFTRETFWHVEKTLMARGAVVGYLTGNPAEIASRLQQRGDDMVNSKDVSDLISRYYDVACDSLLPWFPYVDPTEEDADDLIQRANIAQFTAAALNLFTTYVGSVSPRYLILGDRRNGPPPYLHDAAFTPATMTSGRFLLESLHDDTLRESGIANACEENVRELWETLGRPLTVALGMYAAQACTDAGIAFGSVPHPQFVRRFHHSAKFEYGTVIRNALMTGKDLRAWRP